MDPGIVTATPVPLGTRKRTRQTSSARSLSSTPHAEPDPLTPRGRWYAESAVLYNSNMSLNPRSRELLDVDATSFQAFLNPEGEVYDIRTTPRRRSSCWKFACSLHSIRSGVLRRLRRGDLANSRRSMHPTSLRGLATNVGDWFDRGPSLDTASVFDLAPYLVIDLQRAHVPLWPTANTSCSRACSRRCHVFRHSW